MHHSTEVSEAALRQAEDIVALASKSGGGVLADAHTQQPNLYDPINPMMDVPFAAKVDLEK